MKSLVRREHRAHRVVRSYVLEPYQLVKDLETGVSTDAVKDVLDGKIDEFLTARLAARKSLQVACVQADCMVGHKVNA